jgi:hypothetical protein
MHRLAPEPQRHPDGIHTLAQDAQAKAAQVSRNRMKGTPIGRGNPRQAHETVPMALCGQPD